MYMLQSKDKPIGRPWGPWETHHTGTLKECREIRGQLAYYPDKIEKCRVRIVKLVVVK